MVGVERVEVAVGGIAEKKRKKTFQQDNTTPSLCMQSEKQQEQAKLPEQCNSLEAQTFEMLKHQHQEREKHPIRLFDLFFIPKFARLR